MIGRREIRVRVFQVLYAWLQMEKQGSVELALDLLRDHLKNARHAALLTLEGLRLLAYEEHKDTERRKAKFRPSDLDLKYRSILAEHASMKVLESAELQKALRKEKLTGRMEPDAQRGVYRELREQDFYVKWQEGGLSVTDARPFAYLLKNFLPENEEWNSVMETLNLNWSVDAGFAMDYSQKKLEQGGDSPDLSFNEIMDNEDREFMNGLLTTTIQHGDEMEVHVGNRTKNWEPDRLALLDRILLKMALCEFVHFPGIPVKVTINEYLEIAKAFSTPQSKGFINGILDQLMKDFKEKGWINKSGRGLVE